MCSLLRLPPLSALVVTHLAEKGKGTRDKIRFCWLDSSELKHRVPAVCVTKMIFDPYDSCVSKKLACCGHQNDQEYVHKDDKMFQFNSVCRSVLQEALLLGCHVRLKDVRDRQHNENVM